MAEATEVPDREIRLLLDPDGWWTAIDEETGVASQGETRTSALENLDEAVARHEGDAGAPVTDADLRELGIDPAEVPDEPGGTGRPVVRRTFF